jgi:hypothetical protein
MARNTFGIGDLNAAQPGLSKLAQALVGGDQSYQQGFEGGATAQSKIALALAQIRNQQAEAGMHDATARETGLKADALANRPKLYREQVSNLSGVDGPTVDAYREQLDTGVAPKVPMGPPTADGQMGVGSLVLPDATRSRLVSAFQQFAPLLANTGDVNAEQMAKASQLFRENNLSDDIIAGRVNRNTVGGAQAAVGGKPIYNTNSDGAVLDQFTGGLNTNNPLARSTIGLRGAQAGEASARGRLATAQAGEVGNGKFDPGSGTIIDPRTGRATPVIDVTTGKPIGPKQGAGGNLNQEQANALGFGSRMQDADKVLSDLAKKGVMRPGTIYSAASSLPVVGGIGADLTNFTQSGDQQQIDQAQRNFINATLRRESGASISPGEFENARRQYFDQPGDKDAVLAQKAANRKRVIQSMFAAVPENLRTLPALPGDASPAPAGKPIAVDY